MLLPLMPWKERLLPTAHGRRRVWVDAGSCWTASTSQVTATRQPSGSADHTTELVGARSLRGEAEARLRAAVF